MRTKAHRYSATVPSATFTSGTDVIGVTGDFDGGFVLTTVAVTANIAAGQWMQLQCKVDGVAQGANTGAFQTGSFIQVLHAITLRIPQGRHRISVLWTSSTAPIAAASAELSVAELNA